MLGQQAGTAQPFPLIRGTARALPTLGALLNPKLEIAVSLWAAFDTSDIHAFFQKMSDVSFNVHWVEKCMTLFLCEEVIIILIKKFVVFWMFRRHLGTLEGDIALVNHC